MNICSSIFKYIVSLVLIVFGLLAFISYSFNLILENGTSIQQNFESLFTLSFWKFTFGHYWNFSENYSLFLISISLFSALLLFLSYAFFYRFFSLKFLKNLHYILDLIENLPVVAIVIFLQWSFIQIYKLTQIRLLNTIGTASQPVIFVPFLIVTIFPTIFLIKYMTPFIKDCYQSNYFLFARSLGYTNLFLFLRYTVPNLVRPLESIIGMIYLEMISVMVFIELQFNTGGTLTKIQSIFEFPTNNAALDTFSYLCTLWLPYIVVKFIFKVYKRVN